MTYQPSADRYEGIKYRYTGGSGLKLPEISFGLWHNFGHNALPERAREMCRTAFDHGITHFDLANNYGPPPGSAEEHFGDILATDFRGYRDELIDLDQSRLPDVAGPLRRMGQPEISACRASTRASSGWGSTMSTSSIRTVSIPTRRSRRRWARSIPPSAQGKALYAGISSYNAKRTARGRQDPARPRHALPDPPAELFDAQPLDRSGRAPRYAGEGGHRLHLLLAARPGSADQQVPRRRPRRTAGRKAAPDPGAKASSARRTSPAIRGLNDIAARRGQSLAQMAIAWVLRDSRVTSALIGASRPEQITDLVKGLDNAGL